MSGSRKLKNCLQANKRASDRLLLLLAGLATPVSLTELRNFAEQSGIRWRSFSNPHAQLASTNGKAIKTSDGWELTDLGVEHVNSLGFDMQEPVAIHLAGDLRKVLGSIDSLDTRAFVSEAIGCYEYGFFRSAITMSWQAAVGVLHNYVLENCLREFNLEAKRVNPKWKPARTTDDLGAMREAEFLDRLASISVIGKNVKARLGRCLDLRNGCGHPNSLKLGANEVAAHIESLLLNVFQKYQVEALS